MSVGVQTIHRINWVNFLYMIHKQYVIHAPILQGAIAVEIYSGDGTP